MYNIYLDNCCYGRPYDDLMQPAIKNEASAILEIIELCRMAEVKIIGSSVVVLETGNIGADKIEKRNFIQAFYDDTVDGEVLLDSSDYVRAKSLQAEGLGAMDGQHLAAAEAAGVAYLLSTDGDFVKKTERKKISKSYKSIRLFKGGKKMGAIAAEMSRIADIVEVGDYALNQILGVDGMRTYINYYVQTAAGYPCITAAQFAEAIKRGEARLAEINANYTGPRGDYTKERHEYPQRAHEEIIADIERIQKERARKVPIIPRAVGK